MPVSLVLWRRRITILTENHNAFAKIVENLQDSKEEADINANLSSKKCDNKIPTYGHGAFML